MATADTYVAVSQLLEVRVQLAGQRVSFRAVLVRHKSDFLHHISDKYRTYYRDAVGIGLGILSSLPGHSIDSDEAIWLLGLAVVILAISRIAEMGNKADS